ncbi:MAG: 50S ribosomal protein L18 [Nanoarchaeota archaeon]|nr:50S ribosomal protein L18 [Nanoarchaeota archaeon]
MPKTQKKRKQQRRTSYKKRLGMLKSGKDRIAIRKSNNYILIQLITSNEAKDKVLINVNSKELIKNGWPKELEGSLKSVSAAYLTGYLFGKKLLEKKKDSKVILDLGLQRNVHGNRLYAALNGIVDSGVEIAHDKKVFPSEDRVNGKHLKENVQKIIKTVMEKIK